MLHQHYECEDGVLMACSVPDLAWIGCKVRSLLLLADVCQEIPQKVGVK